MPMPSARRQSSAAMDQIDLPQAVPEGASPIDAVSEWEDHDGPLAGNVIERYNLAFGDAERRGAARRWHAALAAADSDAERAWILAGVASGLTGAALANYLKRLHGLSDDQLDGLDPTTHPLVQPDGTTCGSSSLVMARMRNDPAYAMWITTGYDPETGETTPGTAQDRFDSEALKMHDRTNAAHDRDGDPQWPYPDDIGTAPWAVANEMSADGRIGTFLAPSTKWTTVDPDDRRSSYQALTAAVEDGHSVPMFVGNSVAAGSRRPGDGSRG